MNGDGGRASSPGLSALHEPDVASESDGLEPCPWCARRIWPGSWVVRHNIGTPAGIAPLAVLHATCSRQQRAHEEDFGDR